MKSRLEPIADGIETLPVEPASSVSFAIFKRPEMVSLARSIPDAQSAVLFCLQWHAALQQRMRRGPLAGQQVARVSAGTLAEITECPVRTVYAALSKLQKRHLIQNIESRPGLTAIYRLTLHKNRTQAPPRRKVRALQLAAV
jgi:hypothetical protein